MTTECENCGASKTNRYARVFGDNYGVLHYCGDCLTHSNVQDGSAAGLDG